MKKERSVIREIIVISVSIIVVLIPTIDMIGHPLRLVHVLTISAGSFAAGISAGRLFEKVRRERQERSMTGVK